jgi:hypothetical protein
MQEVSGDEAVNRENHGGYDYDLNRHQDYHDSKRNYNVAATTHYPRHPLDSQRMG